MVNNNYNRSLCIPPATCQCAVLSASQTFIYFNHPWPPFYKCRNRGTEQLSALPNVIQPEQGFRARQSVSRVSVLNHLSLPCPNDESQGSLQKLEGRFCILYGSECHAHPQHMTTSINLQLCAKGKYRMRKLELIAMEVTDAHVQWTKER